MKDRFKKCKQILNELSEKIFPDERNNFMEKLLKNAKDNQSGGRMNDNIKEQTNEK